MITLTIDDRYEILQRARKIWPHILLESSTSIIIDATLEQIRLNEVRNRTSDNEPEPMPAGMDYISEDGYLHTWDGKTWRNDGPVCSETRICLRMIRALTDRIVTLEGQLR